MGAWIETCKDLIRVSISDVAPLVGAWIETKAGKTSLKGTKQVAPLVGAWIETARVDEYYARFRRTPRGCVD